MVASSWRAATLSCRVFFWGAMVVVVFMMRMEVRSLVLRLGCGVWVAVVSGDDALVGKSDDRVYREGGG